MVRVSIALIIFLLTFAANADVDPVSRLQHATTLRCSFVDLAVTEFDKGHKSIKDMHDQGSATYDNINIRRGTARIIGNVGASDLSVRWSDNALWFIETTPAGTPVLTTVFPQYVEGTDEFIIVESKHIQLSTIILAESSSGSCKILQ